MKRILFMATALMICNAQLQGAQALENQQALSPQGAAQEMVQWVRKTDTRSHEEANRHLQNVRDSGINYQEVITVLEQNIASTGEQLENDPMDPATRGELQRKSYVTKLALRKTQLLRDECQ